MTVTSARLMDRESALRSRVTANLELSRKTICMRSRNLMKDRRDYTDETLDCFKRVCAMGVSQGLPPQPTLREES